VLAAPFAWITVSGALPPFLVAPETLTVPSACVTVARVALVTV
jgi:hypothetical protein